MREALAAKQEHCMGMPVNPNENMVAHLRLHRGHDGRHDDHHNPGDKVIIFSPFYENYGADAILSGAEPHLHPAGTAHL